MYFYYLKNHNDALFNIGLKISAFLSRSLKTMLNFEVEILSLQQLEYEVD